MGSKSLDMRPKKLLPVKAEFSIFTEEEIRKMCVTKICTPMTFDAFGHPLPGGLYDKTLGPMKEMEACATCYRNKLGCPGHFGYIELPLPVVNPLFNRIIFSLLRMTCLSCFHIQLPGHLKHSLIVQIKLLNCGLVTEALDVEAKVMELIGQYQSYDNIPEDVVLPTREYEDLADNQTETDESNLNKNIESLRFQFINGLLKTFKLKKVCMSCKQPLDRITTLKGKLILTTNKIKAFDTSTTMLSGKIKASDSKFVTPEQSKGFMRMLWQAEKPLLLRLMPVLNKIDLEHPTDVLYYKVIPVPPSNVRPVNVVKGMVSEHPQTKVYKMILQNAMAMRTVIQVVKNDGDLSSLPIEAKGVYALCSGVSPVEKLNNIWELLQTDINNLVDNSAAKKNEIVGQGLKQVIEKKAGVIRQHMMGKRVNYAARSVIAPDPNLNIEEVGIPEEFAKTLTYPIPVTTWNVEYCRGLINNGPKVHPGAVMVEYENGMKVRINPEDKTQQESILKRLLTPDDQDSGFKGVKLVYRHLINGDIMLLNRQPTLHKPSIMAHQARILKDEKVIRMHYANCKAYNADFDGDEMNAHFPQNELGRSEGYYIANVCNQYLVPKDGTPLSGLIQDHIIAGVRLSVRGKFFSKGDYHQLVFQALAYKTSDIILLPPTILKPVVLWSGKQVLSTVIINIIPKGKEYVNLTATSKISSNAWQNSKPRKWVCGGSPFTYDNCMTEAEVIIRNGELLSGVLDKTHYGATPYGLVHCMYELYGGPVATRLLSSFAKLFTYFPQRAGFTLGPLDILVTKEADKKRQKIIKKCRKIGTEAITKAMNIPEDTPLQEIVEKIDESSASNPKLRSVIDRQYKSFMDSFTNDINKTCLPAGLISQFPDNNLQLMVQSGAKGSTVNTMQISCLLGQIELEGKRPPIMISGKGLPSFADYEFSPRAGGFVDGRFMTGINNQEFFFHCMAGREGLIDTAVKTSRSGYLQRCLVKHLEGLKVEYDMTVRDSDGSVIQFQYGEDGMDISKVQFLNKKQLPFLKENIKAIVDKDTIKKLKVSEDFTQFDEHIQKLNNWCEMHGDAKQKIRNSPFTNFTKAMEPHLDNLKHPHKIDKNTGRQKKTKHLTKLWRNTDEQEKEGFSQTCERCPEPISSVFQPDVYFGAMNERLYGLLEESNIKKKKLRKELENTLKLKSMQSLAPPGEPVGLLAAQSIGEPSTQMTLNTFHFAGRGDMNVTLGIPRLREILMMASKNIKTPSMEIPFLDVPKLEKQAEKLRKTLTRVVVADILEKVDVEVSMKFHPVRQQLYTLNFQFLPYKLYKAQYRVKPKAVLKHMEKKFFGQMFAQIRKASKAQANMVFVEEEKAARKTTTGEDDEEEGNEADKTRADMTMDQDSSDSEIEDEEDAKQTSKFHQAHDEQEPDEEEVENPDEEDDEDPDEKPKTIVIDDDNLDEDVSHTENAVVDSYTLAKLYKYDTQGHSWCEITFTLPIHFKKIDLTAILREVAEKSVLWEVPLIKRAITYMKDDRLTLRTDGINIVEMFKYRELLDLNKLYSNDVHKIAETYGIEAATKAIVREVRDVFNVYGITVDPRHLSLIADYMTYNGTFEPMNRKGMESSASPFQQMSFEASLVYLKGALAQGKEDYLQNPSSCLMLGKTCNTGTGSFSLFTKLAC